MENLSILVQELRKLDKEKSWLEFKHNYNDPEMIGKDICALANGAAFGGRNKAYFIWGIDDESHDIVGTTFDLSVAKKGNQELENWLRSMLSANVDFEFENVVIDGYSVGVMTIQCAMSTPVNFKKVEYIRVGSYTKKLMDYPALQSRLWSKLQNVNFEENIAMQDMELKEALQKLNCDAYFDMTDTVNPMEYKEIGHYLLEEGIVVKQDNGK